MRLPAPMVLCVSSIGICQTASCSACVKPWKLLEYHEPLVFSKVSPIILSGLYTFNVLLLSVELFIGSLNVAVIFVSIMTFIAKFSGDVLITTAGVVSGIAAVLRLYSLLSLELQLASVLFTTK